MIKIVIFDADGMLVHQERPSVFLPRDYGISIEKLNEFFDGPFQECLVGKKNLEEVLVPYLSSWGWDKDVEAFLNLWFTRDVSVDQKLVEYIKNLRGKGVKCFLATNQEKNRFKYMLNGLGLAHVFDDAFASAHLGHKKPNHDFFFKIFKDLKNIKKDEILFWDDRQKNIDGAKEFGINAELFTSRDEFIKKMLQYGL